MILIHFRKTKTATAYSTVWNIGDSKPSPDRTIDYIIVTKKELAHIIDHFKNVPLNQMKLTQEQTWFGDDAKFIMANI